MIKNIFDDGPVSEYEMLASQEQPSQYENTHQYDRQEQYQPLTDSQPMYDLEEQESDILSEAMIRLEQARLYEMLIKHDIFEGVTCNQVALDNVQMEMKNFILDRLQVLLGIKQDSFTPKYSEKVKVELPFNKMEIEALKDIANKLTKGKSSTIEEKEVVEATPEPEIRQQRPKPLMGNKITAKTKEVPSRQNAKPQHNEIPKTTQKRVTPQKTQVNQPKDTKKRGIAQKIDQIDVGPLRGPDGTIISKEEMEIAKQQLIDELSKGKQKSVAEMEMEELIARDKQTQTQAVSRSTNRIPMPDPTHMAGIYVARQAQQRQSANGDGLQGSELDAILAKTLFNK
jgi:hypothetical protein